MSADALRVKILQLTQEYYEETFGQTPGYQTGDAIRYGGRVFDHRELQQGVASVLDFWLTAGPYADQFERKLAAFLGVSNAALVNSGSSANLLAVMALTSPLLGDRRLCAGDEVITVACAFPTTVAPIVQAGAIPVFVDVTLPSGNIDVTQLEAALSSKSKAVILAHTLGNPFDLSAVKAFCDAHKLWLIEDNCDALGSKVTIDGQLVQTGTVGHLGTSSFYPPHHMTMGEGGAVYTNDPLLHKIVVSMRDWGRDCRCPSGHDGVCGHRFDRQYGDLPLGYDHKYVYAHLGYNLKATEMQAAIGVAQLEKLPEFVKIRRENHAWLGTQLADLGEKLLLPEALPSSEPSWFGYLMVARQDGLRDKMVKYLESHRIQTRMLFSGNLLRHPCMEGVQYRTVGTLTNTDSMLHNAFWVGVYPGMTAPMLADMAAALREAALRD